MTKSDRYCSPLPRLRLAAIGVVGLTVMIAAPSFASAQSAPQNACAAKEFRQFDFWVGEWTVTTLQGAEAGRNRIDRILGGCALQENWVGASGNVGHSYNAYDRTRDVWHQTWVDNGGLVLRLEGGVEGSAMVLRGTTTGTDGSTVHHRITWSNVEGDADRVRQHWESSTDAGETWTTAFDGLYTRVEGH